ncbi:carboxypeptidase-like regulatory domain-containing protein, partial [Bacteroides finegoldii]
MRIYLRLLAVFLLLFAGNILYAEAQQEKRVTGTVISEGEPLPGVSVQLKGASSGTITDIDGNYSIEAPGSGTLVFRFVGMRTVEQPVNNRSVINITLEAESKELDEVMVVAYATAKKYSFTGAASTMKAGEIEKLQTSSVSRVLEGTVSGVQASAASGQPGTDAEIRIR